MQQLTVQTGLQPDNFSEFNQPDDHYERAPTRGRPSAGPWGDRWQTRRLNSLNSVNNWVLGFLAGKRVASIASKQINREYINQEYDTNTKIEVR